jgi:co-chaperonin GroES (HSP10)
MTETHYPKPVANAVNVIIEGGQYNDEISVGGKTLYIDPSFRTGHHRKQTGIVVATPLFLSAGYRVNIDVQIGDKVYFHHNSLSDHTKHVTKDGQTYYRIPYDFLFCSIRYPEMPEDAEGKMSEADIEDFRYHCKRVILHNGKVLVDEVFDENVVTSSGIALVADADAKQTLRRNFGRVMLAGKMQGFEDDELAPNDLVVFTDNSEYINQIEDKRCMLMRRDDIIAKVEEVA